MDDLDLREERARALELLRAGRRFLLAGHVRPDGDCLGAEAALARVLAASGKDVRILNPDPPAPVFDYLAEHARFEAYEGGDVPAHDVLVLLDINELSRCGDMAPLLARAPSRKVIVDHHLNHGEPWWDAAYVDVKASASGLLVWRIARELGYEPDGPFAEAVYTSLVTDTGWFRYSNTDAETMDVAARLVAAGVSPDLMYTRLFQRRAQAEPRAIGAVLERLEYFAGGRLAVVDEPRDGRAPLDNDPVLDLVRAVEDVEVVLYLKELDGVVKLSARSKTDYDVNALARRFGGGGHAKASGATIPGALADVRGRVVRAALEGFPSEEPARRG